MAGFRADLNLVRDGFARFDLLDDRVRFLQGPMDATLSDAPIEQLALLRIGRSAGDQIRTVLEHLYDRVSDGGFIIVDVGDDAARTEQTEAFRRARGISAPIERIGNSALSWRRRHTAPRRSPAAGRRTVTAPALLWRRPCPATRSTCRS